MINSLLARWLSRSAGRELAPTRAKEVAEEYDINRGFAAYHERCRSLFDSPNLATVAGPPSSITQNGVEILPVLKPARAAEIIGLLEKRYARTNIKKDSSDLVGWDITHPELIDDILGNVLQGNIDRRITDYFGCSYLVHWATFTVASSAAPEATVSFNWHCDKGPTAHLKLMVYLNSNAEHDGTTAFLDRDQTDRLKDKGYVFGWTKARVSDLAYIEKRTGLKLLPVQPHMNAGDGILFEPSRVMHKGVNPTYGERCVLTLCLLPSPMGWREAMALGTRSDLATDPNWHGHTNELLSKMRLPPT